MHIGFAFFIFSRKKNSINKQLQTKNTHKILIITLILYHIAKYFQLKHKGHLLNSIITRTGKFERIIR
jgi:hypothetical protein